MKKFKRGDLVRYENDLWGYPNIHNNSTTGDIGIIIQHNIRNLTCLVYSNSQFQYWEIHCIHLLN